MGDSLAAPASQKMLGSLKQMQELDKVFFPSKDGKAIVQQQSTEANPGPTVGPAVYNSPTRFRPDTALGSGGNSSTQARRGKARNKQQRQQQLRYNSNPDNPYEVVLEAEPVTRRVNTTERYQLKLDPPTGSKARVVAQLEGNLQRYLTQHLTQSTTFKQTSYAATAEQAASRSLLPPLVSSKPSSPTNAAQRETDWQATASASKTPCSLTSGGQYIHLADLLTAKPGARCHALRLSEWLDTAIADVWQQHSAADSNLETAWPHSLVPPMQLDASPRRARMGTAAVKSNADVIYESPLIPQSTQYSSRAGISGMKPPGTDNIEGISNQPDLLHGMLQVVHACATAFVQRLGSTCMEDGLLLARCWNLHSALMDAQRAAAQNAAEHLAQCSSGLQQEVNRMGPLLDWELESRGKLKSMNAELQSTSAELLLASRERDALLRENDKIIAYYRKEFKAFRKEQQRAAYRLAKKCRNAQHQLLLVQRDRDQLFNAVNFVSSTSAQMLDQVERMNVHLGSISNRGKAHDANMHTDLEGIQKGLRAIQTTVNKVVEISKGAEEEHFVVEEQVTAAQAADEDGDELTNAVLAAGDPDAPPGTITSLPDLPLPSPTSKSMVDAEAQQSNAQNEQEGDDTDVLLTEPAQVSVPPIVPPLHLPASTVTFAEGTADGAATAAGGSEGEISPDGEGLVSSRSQRSVTFSEAQAESDDMCNNDDDDEWGDAESVELVDQDTQTTARGPPPGARRKTVMVKMVELGTQTDNELARSLTPQDVLDQVASFNSVLNELKLLPGIDKVLQEQGIGDGDPDSIVSAVRIHVNRLQSEVDELKEAVESMEGADKELRRTLDTRNDDLYDLQKQCRQCQSAYQALCSKLQSLGMDPDNPVLPAASATAAPSPRNRTQSIASAVKSLAQLTPRSEQTDAPSTIAALTDDETNGITSPQSSPSSPSRSRSPSPNSKSKPPLSRSPVNQRGTVSPSLGNKLDGASNKRNNAKFKAVARAAAGSRKDGNVTDAAAGQAKASQPPFVPSDPAAPSKPLPVYLRPDRATNASKLADALQKYSDVRPKELPKVLRLIDELYKGKTSSDDQRAKLGQAPLALVDYIFQHYSTTRGTLMVSKHAAELVQSVEARAAEDTRVATFQKFLSESWDVRVLGVYMEAMKRLADPARVPCCDLPATDYAASQPAMADVRKCLWVADKLLGKRATKTAYTFAGMVASHSEPIPQQDLEQYFVAPGFYGADVVNVRQMEVARAEFRRVAAPVFLEMLCEEYLRCEAVYKEVLPDLFKKCDTNHDGYLSQPDLLPMIQEVLPPDTPEADIQAAADSFWQGALSAEQGAVPLTARSTSDSPGKRVSESMAAVVSYRSFVEAAYKSDLLRSWVRLHRTPPPSTTTDGDGSGRQSASKLLLLLVNRHWQRHGRALENCFAEAGAVEMELNQQVTTMAREPNSMRKAAALLEILRLLLVQRLARLGQFIRVESMAAVGLDTQVEMLLNRLTAAVKLAYGTGLWALEEDVMDTDAWSLALVSHAQRAYQQQVVAAVSGLNTRLRLTMSVYSSPYLEARRDVQYCARVWKQRALAKTLARRQSTAYVLQSVASEATSLMGTPRF